MQGNSKYLRWSPLYTCCCVFVILSSTIIAVPVRPRRMVRETFSFDTVATNTISNATCFRDGIEVQKSTVKCEIKTGCKLIQKTGECCPEYQCQCSHEDRIYENGEKIVSHNPCRRCVCKGGEVTCNDVSCYIRDDCKPRYVKGVCCPQFDNCPPIDDVQINAAKETDSKSSKNDVIVSMATATTVNGTPKDDINPMLQLANENPLGIKIKEITKPEEIRITDDKPKPFNPFKSTTTTTTTTTIAPTTTNAEISSEASTKLATESTTTVNSFTTEDINQSLNSSEHESRDYMDDGVSLGDSSSTAPPTKASAQGEVEPQELLTSADSNSITDDSANKSVRQTIEHSTIGDVDQSSEIGYFSSTTEISTESSTSFSETSTTSSESGEEIDLVASSTPKNVVIVRNGDKTESFRISGTDGLQRVEELEVVLSSTTESSQEESADVVTQSSEIFVSTDNIGGRSSEEMVFDGSSTTSLPDIFDEFATVSLTVDMKIEKTSNFNDSSVEHITSMELSTPDDGLTENSSELMAVSEKIYDTVFYPEVKSTASPLNEESFDTIFYGSTEDILDSSSTTEGPDTVISSTDGSFSTTEQNVGVSASDASSTTKGASTEPTETSSSRVYSFEEDEVTPAENPEYPYIPDDLSIHNKDTAVEEEEKRRLPSKVSVEETVSSTAGPMCDDCDTAKSGEVSTTQGPSIENVKMLHKMDVIESRAPGEPHLIPEWERSTTQKVEIIVESTTLGPNDATTTTANEINKTAIMKENVSNVNKSAALMVENVDSDEKYGRKEPTTERPTTKGYANMDDIEEGSASSAQSEFVSSTDGVSPKDDAESIKFSSSGSDESANESYSNEKSIVSNPFQNYWRFVANENGWSI